MAVRSYFLLCFGIQSVQGDCTACVCDCVDKYTVCVYGVCESVLVGKSVICESDSSSALGAVSRLDVTSKISAAVVLL